MTCKDCGQTVGWDCYCNNDNGDYNRMLDEYIKLQEKPCPHCGGPNDHGDECRHHVGDLSRHNRRKP